MVDIIHSNININMGVTIFQLLFFFFFVSAKVLTISFFAGVGSGEKTFQPPLCLFVLIFYCSIVLPIVFQSNRQPNLFKITKKKIFKNFVS